MLFFISEHAFTQPYPINYNVYLNTFQGGSVRLFFQNIDDLESGKTLTYKTVLGLTLQDPDGRGVGDDYQAFSIFVGTPDASITSLDGSITIPLNVLEITASQYPGSNLDGVVSGTMTFETYQPTVTIPAATTFVELFRSDRSKDEDIVASNHQIEIEYRIGVTNPLPSVPAGIYTLELQFCLCAEDDVGLPSCPPPF